MQPAKRLGTESSATRAALIDAAAQLIRDEGYVAVTSRRVAEKAGLKHQLIYYYFNTLGDLLLEVFERAANWHLEQLRSALSSDRPLHALWEVNSDPRSIRLNTEFTALGNHHEKIRAALAAHGDRARSLEESAIALYLERRGVDPSVSPMVLTVLLSALSRILLIERTLGMSVGHAETEAVVHRWLSVLEDDPPAQLQAKTGRAR